MWILVIIFINSFMYVCSIVPTSTIMGYVITMRCVYWMTWFIVWSCPLNGKLHQGEGNSDLSVGNSIWILAIVIDSVLLLKLSFMAFSISMSTVTTSIGTVSQPTASSWTRYCDRKWFLHMCLRVIYQFLKEPQWFNMLPTVYVMLDKCISVSCMYVLHVFNTLMETPYTIYCSVKLLR